MKVNIYKNCATSPTIHTITPIPVNELDITYDKLGTGVYKVELEIKKQDGSIYKESNCRFIDCDEIKCSVYKDFPNNVDNVLAYEALVASNDCENCSCDRMCIIYSQLQNDKLECTPSGCMCS